MKRCLLLVCVIFWGFTFTAHAALYKIYVKRIDSNLYKDTQSGSIIETKYCYEYAYGEEAVLKYDKYSYDNKIIFASGTTCDVKDIR